MPVGSYPLCAKDFTQDSWEAQRSEATQSHQQPIPDGWVDRVSLIVSKKRDLVVQTLQVSVVDFNIF